MGSAGGGGAGSVFPVILNLTGGSNGTSTTAATFRYTVTKGGVQVAFNVNPALGGHKWRRAIGRMVPATDALAILDANENVQIFWTNEIYEHSTCVVL